MSCSQRADWSHTPEGLIPFQTLQIDFEYHKEMCDSIVWERFELLQSQFMRYISSKSAAQLKQFYPIHLFPERQTADKTNNFHCCHILQTDVNLMSEDLGMPDIVLQHKNDVNFPTGPLLWVDCKAADNSCFSAPSAVTGEL